MSQKRTGRTAKGLPSIAEDQQTGNVFVGGTAPTWWSGLSRHSKWLVFGLIAFLSIGVFGAGCKRLEEDAGDQNRIVPKDQSQLSKVDPIVTPPVWDPTPQLSKEYIYAGSRLLAVEDANANAAPPADVAIWRPSTGTWWVMGGQGSVATIGLWTSNKNIGTKDLEGVGTNIQKQIESKWKGSFKESDWKFDFSAKVTVTVFDRAKSTNDVLNTDNKIMNVIEIDNHKNSEVYHNQAGNNRDAGQTNPDGYYPDVGGWDYNASRNSDEPVHEFGHVAGAVDGGRDGGGVTGKDLVAQGSPQAPRMSKRDFDSTIGGVARYYRDYWVERRKENRNLPSRQTMQPYTRACCK